MARASIRILTFMSVTVFFNVASVFAQDSAPDSHFIQYFLNQGKNTPTVNRPITAEQRKHACKLGNAANLAMGTINKDCKAGGSTFSGEDSCGTAGGREPGKIGSGVYKYSKTNGADMKADGDKCKFGEEGGNFVADCSSFVSGILCRSGALAKPNGKPERVGTAAMAEWGPPCFQKNPTDGFDVGDIIVKGGDPGHVVIICGNKNPQPTWDTSALEVCEAASSNTGIIKSSLTKVIANSPKISEAVGRADKGGVLRHTGDSSCMDKTKRTFPNEDALQKCSSPIKNVSSIDET